MPCPILPILVKYFPDAAAEAQNIGDNPENSREFLIKLNLWDDEWDALWNSSQRHNNDLEWLEHADGDFIQKQQAKLARLVIELIQKKN